MFISHATRASLLAQLVKNPQYMNQELPDVQDELEKAEEQEIKLPTFVES